MNVNQVKDELLHRGVDPTIIDPILELIGCVVAATAMDSESLGEWLKFDLNNAELG